MIYFALQGAKDNVTLSLIILLMFAFLLRRGRSDKERVSHRWKGEDWLISLETRGEQIVAFGLTLIECKFAIPVPKFPNAQVKVISPGW